MVNNNAVHLSKRLDCCLDDLGCCLINCVSFKISKLAVLHTVKSAKSAERYSTLAGCSLLSFCKPDSDLATRNTLCDARSSNCAMASPNPRLAPVTMKALEDISLIKGEDCCDNLQVVYVRLSRW